VHRRAARNPFCNIGPTIAPPVGMRLGGTVRHVSWPELWVIWVFAAIASAACSETSDHGAMRSDSGALGSGSRAGTGGGSGTGAQGQNGGRSGGGMSGAGAPGNGGCFAYPSCMPGDAPFGSPIGSACEPGSCGPCPAGFVCNEQSACFTILCGHYAGGTDAGTSRSEGGMCDPDHESHRRYVTLTPSRCTSQLDYHCTRDTTPFANACGCGCEESAGCTVDAGATDAASNDGATKSTSCPFSNPL
jgi:hypothetical protein